jgi:hypothetical protein
MRRFVVGAALLASVVLVAGCGGDPKADPSPSTSTAPPSVTPTPTPPALPDAAKLADTAGAIAFVKYYVDAVNHATGTGDTSALRGASSAGCESCRGVLAKVDDLYSAGGHSEGGVWRLVEVRVSHAGMPWRVLGHLTYPSQRIVKPGQADETFPPGEYDMEFTLRYRNGGWQVAGWVRQ